MSYLNGQLGFREDILQNRSVIVKDNYAILEPDGLVKNVIHGFENCDITILASPLLGASFCDYLISINEGGKNLKGFGGNGVETFLYIHEGEIVVYTSEGEKTLTSGGYVFTPEDEVLKFENKSSKNAKGFLYKRRYQHLEGHKAHLVIGNVNELEYSNYEDMDNVKTTTLLPADDLGFDMNFHILSFKPGASHGYIETHFQEHGALILTGKGMYNLDNEWFPVQKGDYLFMGSYCPQAAYAVGKDEEFSYIYSKDCNRDPEI
ncbi:MAG: (S)-ureidoglycine aminohydrolase [Tissierellia bacterium]|nr:(S)-ureidoglycine aminohydrolase [Tissierellia bacterium]